MKPVSCCRNDCIRRGKNNEEQFLFIKGCVEEYFDLKREEKANYIMEKIRGCILKPEAKDKKTRYSWTIGVSPNKVISHVCPRAFQLIYHISHGSVENLCREIKKGTISNNRPFNDRASFFVDSRQNTMNTMSLMCDEEFSFKLDRSAKQVLL